MGATPAAPVGETSLQPHTFFAAAAAGDVSEQQGRTLVVLSGRCHTRAQVFAELRLNARRTVEYRPATEEGARLSRNPTMPANQLRHLVQGGG